MSQTTATGPWHHPDSMPRPAGALRLGLVGCGRAAERIYLPALERLAATPVAAANSGIAATLGAVADPRPERRALIAGTIPGCRSFDSAASLFAADIIEAVIITTPPDTHVDIVTLALEAGLPVLVEKPLALTAEDLPALANLAAGKGLPIMVGFNRRYWTPIRRLRKRLRELSSLDNARARLLFISGHGAWNPIETVGGALEDLGSHQLDLLAYFFDSEIKSINAQWDEDGGPDSGIHMLVEMANGATAECRATRTGSTAERILVEDGLDSNGHYLIHPGSEQFHPPGGPVRLLMDGRDALGRRLLGRRSSLRTSYERQLDDFIFRVQAQIVGEALLGADLDVGDGANIEDGIAAVEAVDAARRSANKGGVREGVK